MTIRTEENRDYKSVSKLIEQAFKDVEYSDHKEHFLVERLRKSEAFVPELSMVAEVDGQLVGYVLLTRIKITNEHTQPATSLALAPIAILPAYQGKGIGGELILTIHEKAKALGFTSVVLLGHEDYYPRFGYKMAKEFGINLPFDVPDENCMVIELTENALQFVNGTVVYPKEFYE